MEREIYALRKKEKSSTNQLFRITSNLRKLEERREKNMSQLRIQLQGKKKEISRLEKCLSQQIESSQLEMADSILTSRKSAFIAKSMEDQTESLLSKIVDLERKNDQMRLNQKNLFEDMIDQKRQQQDDISILYSVFLSSLS